MNKKIQGENGQNYYQSLYGRGVINTKVVPDLLKILCFPKLLLDVFLRRKMGERYFSIVWATLLGIFLYFGPRVLANIYHWRDAATFHIFFLAYVIMSLKCYWETKREPSVFDFKRFSLDPGKSLPFFYSLRLFGKSPTQRTIDVYLEPIFCFLIGFGLILTSQYTTGTVIVVASICYFLSNLAFAIRGDNFVMDKIDEIICNQDLTDTFMTERDISPRGVPFYAQKPTTKELREDLLTSLIPDDSDAAVAI